MKESDISWTVSTFNGWVGCSKISDGCDHCYACTMMDTRYGRVEWGVNGTRIRTSPAYWRQPLSWAKAAKKSGKRHRVFTASLSDVFEGDPGDRWGLRVWREELFALIMATPELDWMLLTKRPAKAASFFRDVSIQDILKRRGSGYAVQEVPREWPLPNVWMGTSVEDQERADERIPELLKIPAAVRFISAEPLLGPLDLKPWLTRGSDRKDLGLDWVITGGESGPNARVANPDWFRSVRDQCVAANVPFHHKQHGMWVESAETKKAGKREMLEGIDGRRISMRWVGKHKAGRELDGVVWAQFPVGSGAIASD